MKKIGSGQHGRLSIDILPDEHKQIKIYATLHGQSIRQFVLESIRERLQHESENKEISALSGHFGYVFREIWDNEKDAEYDKL